MRWRLAWAVLLWACAAQAAGETWRGGFDTVEVRAEGTRFSATRERLHLYATGPYREVLLAGFFRRAVFTVGYTPFPCGGGVSGTCGTVYSVTVEEAAFR